MKVHARTHRSGHRSAASSRLARLAAVFVFVSATSVASLATSGTALAGGGSSDAAHACQQTGYLTLHRSDGSGFANTGDCVSYAAKGGTFPACTVTATTGCLIFDNLTIPDYWGSGNTVTVNGAFSFATGCPGAPDYEGYCLQYPLPNDQAIGAATYTVKNSAGLTLAQGTLTAANTPGSSEGLLGTQFQTSGGGPASTCSAAYNREVIILVTDSAAPDLGSAYSAAVVGGVSAGQPAGSGISEVDLGNYSWFQGTGSSITVTC